MFVPLSDYMASHKITLKDIESLASFKSGVLLITGSLAAGHGTSQSDLDVHVILENVDELDFNPVYPIRKFQNGDHSSYTMSVKGTPVDVELFSINDFRNILKRVDEFNFNDKSSCSFNYLVENMSNECAISFMHRIYTGIKVSGDMDIDFKKMIDHSAWFKWKTMWHINLCDNILEDLIGFYDIRYSEGMFYSTRALFTHLALAFLSNSKLSIDREKWIFWTLNEAKIGKGLDTNVYEVALRSSFHELVDGKKSAYYIDLAQQLMNELSVT